MGEKIIASPQLVRPSQDYLFQGTIDFYKKTLLPKKKQVPIPVMLDYIVPNGYVALDGHHKVAATYSNYPQMVLWVVSSPNDFIPYQLFPDLETTLIDACNNEIRRRFNTAISYVARDDKGDDILSFDRLIEFANVRI
jgi:hypothetical protein